MVNPLALIQRGLNTLLPFATPGTPLIQDLLHLAAICTALYYAPQIQAYIQDRRNPHGQYQADDQPQDTNPIPQVQGDAGINQAAPPQPFVEDAEEDDEDSDDEDDQEIEFDGADNFGNQQPLDDGAPGPVNPRPQAPANSSTRTVGAKKAKSLARRDQRRAYHEFMRSQGEAQRARDAEGAKEREEELAQEKAKRVAKEAQLEAKRAKEREEKKMKEEKAREEEMMRRERAVRLVREEMDERAMSDLEDVARRIGGVSREWVEGLVRASGMLSTAGESRAFLTASGWVVKVSRQDMEDAYREASRSADEEEGTVSHIEIGKQLGGLLDSKAAEVR